MADLFSKLFIQEDLPQITEGSKVANLYSKMNCSKEELSLLTEKELLSKISGWKYNNIGDGLCFEEKIDAVNRRGIVEPYEINIEQSGFLCKGRSRETLDIPTEDILQFYCIRDYEHYSGKEQEDSQYITVYNLFGILKSGQHLSIAIFKDLCDARIFEIVLERRLDIQDRSVLGEYNGMPVEPSKTFGYSMLPRDAAIITDNVFCPKCKLAVDGNQEEISRGINYSCSFCNEIFDSKHKEHAMIENVPDKLLSTSVENKDLVLARKHKNAQHLLSLIFFSFLFLIQLAFTVIHFKDIPIVFIIIIFSLFLFLVLAAFIKHNIFTFIRVSESSINISVKAYNFLSGPSKNIPSSEIKQIFVSRTPIISAARSEAILCVLKNDGTEIVIDKVNGIPLDRAVNILHSMEVLIEKRLGIEDKTVSTEILRI